MLGLLARAYQEDASSWQSYVADFDSAIQQALR